MSNVFKSTLQLQSKFIFILPLSLLQASPRAFITLPSQMFGWCIKKKNLLNCNRNPKWLLLHESSSILFQSFFLYFRQKQVSEVEIDRYPTCKHELSVVCDETRCRGRTIRNFQSSDRPGKRLLGSIDACRLKHLISLASSHCFSSRWVMSYVHGLLCDDEVVNSGGDWTPGCRNGRYFTVCDIPQKNFPKVRICHVAEKHSLFIIHQVLFEVTQICIFIS